ncbi:hypothetical protein POEJIIAE_01869 [Mannheimia haemolytica]
MKKIALLALFPMMLFAEILILHRLILSILHSQLQPPKGQDRKISAYF